MSNELKIEEEEVKKSETKPYRYGEKLTSLVTEGIYTVPEHFDDICFKDPARKLFFWRDVKKYHIEKDLTSGKSLTTVEYTEEKSLTCSQVHEMVKALENGLCMFDPTLKPKSRVGIYSNTCKEWAMAFHAITNMSMTVTTVYATLGWDNLLICINEAELTTIFCEASNVENIDKHLGNNKCPTLKNLVVIGKEIPYRSKEFRMKSVFDLLVDGSSKCSKPHNFPKPKGDDLAILMYTSGTTGTPKGVQILHSNIVASMSSFTLRLKCKENHDVHLSYLPMAHIFELAVYCSILANYGMIKFGNPRTLAAKPGGAKYLGDLAWARPTIMSGVPKVWDTIKKGINGKVRKAGGVKKMLYDWVLSKKLDHLEGKQKFDVSVFMEGLVFKKMRSLMGTERLRHVISGGAPLNPDTQYFMQALVGSKCSFGQGYGLTETAASGITQLYQPEVYTVSNVGYPVSCIEVKLVSCEEMGYTVENNPQQGEIYLRGPSITAGYFKKPEKTRESFDEEGWFHTGDIGEIYYDAKQLKKKKGKQKRRRRVPKLRIIDRKKNLVKMSHGEYVPVESIEVKYLKSEFIQPNGMFLHCDPMFDHVVAIILPDLSFALDFAKNEILLDKKQKNMKIDNNNLIEKIINHPKYLAAVTRSLQDISRREKMRKCETLDLKKIVIRNDLWTPENGCLTAAMKLKRRSLKERYQKEIEGMYQQNMPEEERGRNGGRKKVKKMMKKKKKYEEEEEIEGEEEMVN